MRFQLPKIRTDLLWPAAGVLVVEDLEVLKDVTVPSERANTEVDYDLCLILYPLPA